MSVSTFNLGDRVHYRVYPSGGADTSMTGEVVRVERVPVGRGSALAYRVYWDDIDRTAFPPTRYGVKDLAPFADMTESTLTTVRETKK